MSAEPTVVRLDPTGYRRTAWKNGGGITTDIADRYRPGAEPGGWTGMVWRLGVTRIEAPAPFSDLSGYDRVQAVIGGGGLVLRVADGRALDLREPFRPVAFPGEWAIRSELEDGPVTVLNLIGDRAAVGLDLRFAREGDALSPPIGEHVIVAASGTAEVAVDGETFALERQAAIRIGDERLVALTVRSGLVALASMRARGRQD